MEISLTSIQEPPKEASIPLPTLREQIKALEDAHLDKGTKLSGRILHVSPEHAQSSRDLSTEEGLVPGTWCEMQ